MRNWRTNASNLLTADWVFRGLQGFRFRLTTPTNGHATHCRLCGYTSDLQSGHAQRYAKTPNRHPDRHTKTPSKRLKTPLRQPQNAVTSHRLSGKVAITPPTWGVFFFALHQRPTSPPPTNRTDFTHTTPNKPPTSPTGKNVGEVITDWERET